MDIKEYLKLQKLRNSFKLALQAHLKSNATTLLRKYEKQLLNEVEASKDDTTGTLKVKAILDDFSVNLKKTVELQKADSVEKLTKLWEDSKATLDVQYKTDYLVLPATAIDNYKLLSQVDAIISKYRNNTITELRMKRLIASRLRVTAHVANTIANTQVAGFDNLASKAVADLAMLDKAMYFGPATHPELSHDLCIELKTNNLLYTEAKIKKMSNGQGLPVLIYCGGYNCVHSWVWVDETWVELKEFKVAA